MAGRRMLTLIALAVGTACGTGASSPDSCRQIEEARCRRALACNIRLEPPYSTSGSDVDACIRYYDVACLHGLDVSNQGPTAVSQCVRAIETHDCAVVTTPQNDPACAWLIPPAAATTSDAASDTPVEGASDAAEDTVAE
jgi:hypothetical protein